MDSETVKAMDTYYPGLEGVVACETAIANIEGSAAPGVWNIAAMKSKTLPARSLLRKPRFFSCTATCPTAQLAEFEARLRPARAIPEPLIDLFRRVPANVHPMDVLRTSVSVLAHYDPDLAASPTDHAANVRKAERLMAQMATAVAARVSAAVKNRSPRATISTTRQISFI